MSHVIATPWHCCIIDLRRWRQVTRQQPMITAVGVTSQRRSLERD